MNYYFDTEFVEKTHSLFGMVEKKRPELQLISIGIVSDDDRKYYAINKDFDLRHAWNKYQMEQVYGDMRNVFPDGIMVYWLRENVLRPIFEELWKKMHGTEDHGVMYSVDEKHFTYKNLRDLINIYGKTEKQIASEIKEFVSPVGKKLHQYVSIESFSKIYDPIVVNDICYDQPIFYSYYSAYDWVILCNLFGSMQGLPENFPMYCYDLKQSFNELASICYTETKKDPVNAVKRSVIEKEISSIKKLPNYPVEPIIHHSLYEAIWAKDLHKF